MDLNDALLVCRNGALVRDDGGTMKAGWKVKFVADPKPSNMAKPAHMREGAFTYVNPKGEHAHLIAFRDAHRASWQWRTVSPDE